MDFAPNKNAPWCWPAGRCGGRMFFRGYAGSGWVVGVVPPKRRARFGWRRFASVLAEGIKDDFAGYCMLGIPCLVLWMGI